MVFDWTVSLGNIFTAIAFVGAGLLAFFALRQQVAILAIQFAMLGTRLHELEKDTDKIASALIELARQETRLSAIDMRLNDMSRRITDFSVALARRLGEHVEPTT